MSDFLTLMAEASRHRADEATSGSGVKGLSSRASSALPPRRLRREGFDIIAEAKLRSPSVGRLAPPGDHSARVASLALSYEAAGAAAVSVLTEPDRFDGNLDHLERAVRSVDIPVMRKDFLVDPIQVTEARAFGASGVLLISRILEPAVLEEMVDLALGLGMFALVEVFDENDLDKAAAVFDRGILIGVNTRDLVSLALDEGRLQAMIASLPSGCISVAESGIVTAADAHRVARLGYDMALVGTALVGTDAPGSLLRELLAVGRSRDQAGVAL